jgi:hypothetical protein
VTRKNSQSLLRNGISTMIDKTEIAIKIIRKVRQKTSNNTITTTKLSHIYVLGASAADYTTDIMTTEKQ